MNREQNQDYKKDGEMDRNSDARTTGAPSDSSHDAPGGGISNRPDDEERENQDRLPPRGQEKAGD
jgi:hypothetical protein